MSESLSLKELSERASQGEWSLGDEEGGYRYLNASGVPSSPGPDQNVKWSGFARFVVEMEDGLSCAGSANAELVIGLVNACRAGRLHTSEDLTSAEVAAHAKGRAEGIGEAVAALKAVHGLVSEAAMTGFNYADGDWAERLFTSQGATMAVITSVEPGYRSSAYRALLPTTGGSDADAKR